MASTRPSLRIHELPLTNGGADGGACINEQLQASHRVIVSSETLEKRASDSRLDNRLQSHGLQHASEGHLDLAQYRLQPLGQQHKNKGLLDLAQYRLQPYGQLQTNEGLSGLPQYRLQQQGRVSGNFHLNSRPNISHESDPYHMTGMVANSGYSLFPSNQNTMQQQQQQQQQYYQYQQQHQQHLPQGFITQSYPYLNPKGLSEYAYDNRKTVGTIQPPPPGMFRQNEETSLWQSYDVASKEIDKVFGSYNGNGIQDNNSQIILGEYLQISPVGSGVLRSPALANVAPFAVAAHETLSVNSYHHQPHYHYRLHHQPLYQSFFAGYPTSSPCS